MKKALLIIVALIATLVAVSGTIAFFTDTEEAYGQAASGELSIIQHEYDVYDAADPAACKPYTQGQIIYPGVHVDKIVTVENIGKLVSYVRTFVAVPTAGEGMSLAEPDMNTADWTWCEAPIKNVLIDRTLYDIYYAVYEKQLPAGETTPPCLLGYTVSPNVSQDGTQYVWRNGSDLIPLGDSDVFNILVATEASQAIVFDDAFQAMEATYGKDHHPWQTMLFANSQKQLDDALQASAGDYNTRIGLYQGAYTLPDTLPNGIRFFAMEQNVTILNNALSGYDTELDGLAFPAALTFTGHGDFESVTFENGAVICPTTGDCFADSCIGAITTGTGEYQVIIRP